METLLDRNARLTQNASGLFDLRIEDGAEVVIDVKNITLRRAVVDIENHMYTRRRDDGPSA